MDGPDFDGRIDRVFHRTLDSIRFHAAEECENRTKPAARIIATLVVCTILYIAVVVVLTDWCVANADG